MPKAVREPIQVYLTPEERKELDRAARTLGVSRSEVLRRGIAAVGPARAASSVLRDLVAGGYVTPALASTEVVPPRARTVPFEQLMASLNEDRGER